MLILRHRSAPSREVVMGNKTNNNGGSSARQKGERRKRRRKRAERREATAPLREQHNENMRTAGHPGWTGRSHHW